MKSKYLVVAILTIFAMVLAACGAPAAGPAAAPAADSGAAASGVEEIHDAPSDPE